MWPNVTSVNVTFTEEILDGKINFLCREKFEKYEHPSLYV